MSELFFVLTVAFFYNYNKNKPICQGRKIMQKIERQLPAYPLFVKDPYFSVWSGGEVLNAADPCFDGR